jgi:hypothetical protein
MTVTVGGHDCELGIDVAVYQPAIDWPGVETANRLFTVNKASGGDGALYKDPTFDAHHANAAGHVHRSAYHFLGMGGGASQADALIRATNGLKDLDLPPLVNNCDQDVIKADVLARLLGGAPNTGDGFLATTDSMATTAIWAADQVMERLAYGQDQVSRDAREAIARSDLFHGSGWARIQAEQSGVPAGEGNNQPYPDMARILDAVGALAAEVADLKAKLVHA